MTKQQILELDGKAVTLDQLESIEESADVEKVENLGRSRVYPHMNWYLISLRDGLELSVYF